MRDDVWVERFVANWRLTNLAPADRAMLDYAEKLTLTPWKVTRSDVEALRTVGFSDRAILDINQITGYFAYVNRLADGLGVELESFWDELEK